VTVVAGESGAGKSTVISLLLRFLEAQSGSIFIDGLPLSQIPEQTWNQCLAWMPQQPHLFQGSLAANISLGRPQASPQEIQAAAHLARVDAFIHRFPDRYSMQIGERGIRLSAGQAQRIALARAFLQDAPLLLLDEPAAHVDPGTETQLYESLNKLIQGRTVVIVCHQPPAFLHSDQVIWLKDGEVERVEDTSKNQPEQFPEPSNPPFSDSTPSIKSTNFDRPDSQPNSKYLSRLLLSLSPFSGRVALSILLGFLTVASSMGLMSTAAYLISRAALQPSIAVLQVAIIGVRFFGLSRGIFRYLERLVTHDVTFRLLGRWRGWFYRAVEPLVPARTQQRHSGDLLQRSIGDISALEDFYVRAIAPPFVAILTGLVAWLLLASFSIVLSYFLLGMLLLSGLILPALVLMLNRRAGAKLAEQRAAMNRALVDGIQGMADLLAYGQGEQQHKLIKALGLSLGRTQSRLAAVNGFQNSASRLFADLGMLGVLWLGSTQVQLGNLDGVLLGALVLLAFSSFEAFYPLPQAAQHLSSSLAAARRLFEIADEKPAVSEPAHPLRIPADFHLQVSDVSFSYPDSQDLINTLSNITFSLSPERKIAIVGASGSGKTTLFNLLLRFWESQAGEIKLNGQAYERYSVDELRKKIAVLPQNSTLFSASIWDNLRLAQPEASTQEIEQSARRAAIHDWIASLPDGYQTWVGEAGIKLSGGQRQRIALACTLLRRSPLLMLDEPASHLDLATQRAVLSGILDAVRENQSSLLLITHRLSGMQALDEILVLKDGGIVERGTHAELMAQAGFYHRMWSLQGQTNT
jgi:ATP-binding cassette subfamily C protein CydCD